MSGGLSFVPVYARRQQRATRLTRSRRNPVPSFMRRPIVVCILILGIAAVCDAQTFRGALSGRIADQSGAMLPGVTVTATNDATGVSRTTVTSGNGDFSVPDLQLGMYTIEAALQGFQTVRTKVEVSVSQVASV